MTARWERQLEMVRFTTGRVFLGGADVALTDRDLPGRQDGRIGETRGIACPLPIFFQK